MQKHWGTDSKIQCDVDCKDPGFPLDGSTSCLYFATTAPLLAGICTGRQSKRFLVNNALRHQGYENKPTKKLHLTKCFDVWISQRSYKDFFEQWIKMAIVKGVTYTHSRVKVHQHNLKNKLLQRDNCGAYRTDPENFSGSNNCLTT